MLMKGVIVGGGVGRIFHGCNVIWHCQLGALKSAVILDWMIDPFWWVPSLTIEWSLLMHTLQQRLSNNALQWAGQPPKSPLPIAGSQIPSTTSFLGPCESAPPNGISIGSAIFAGLDHVPVRQTHRQTTLHVTSVSIGCTYATHALRPEDLG